MNYINKQAFQAATYSAHLNILILFNKLNMGYFLLIRVTSIREVTELRNMIMIFSDEAS